MKHFKSKRLFTTIDANAGIIGFILGSQFLTNKKSAME